MRSSATSDGVQQPLQGLLVLDLGQMYNGPYCGLLLALHGARVVKIEPPWGEALRMRAGSPGGRLPVYMLNSGKEGLALNLKTEAGREIFLRLVDQADVVIENFAPGTMAALQLAPQMLLEHNPRLIYAAGTGYGQGGPFSTYPAMDLTIQAMTGVMATTGTEATGPLKTGAAIGDFFGGSHLFAAVLLALLQRGMTGRGQYVEVAMADATLPSLASSIAYYVATTEEPPRTGNRHSGVAYAPYNVYPAADGHLAIFCVRDTHWRALSQVMGRPELAEDPRFATIPARVQHVDCVDEAVAEWVALHTRHDAFAQLLGAEVPSSPVLSVSEVMQIEHYRERGALVPIEHPTGGPIIVPGSPVHLAAAPALRPRPAPEIGGDEATVLRDLLGLGPEQINDLRARGAL